MASDEEIEDVEEELDLSSSDVVTKYKGAAEIANKALAHVISLIKPGVKVLGLCEAGDAAMREQVDKVFNKAVKGKKVEKGIAFPTCVSVNNCVCHYTPSGEDTLELKVNDVVKIDLGVHIDGFISVVAHTVVVQEDATAPVTGRAADLLAATNTAAEVALRLIRPGKKNQEVMAALSKVAEAYGVNAVEGVLSHQMKRFVIDGNKVVLSVSNAETKVDDFEFQENEVYGVDIVLSTGEGKPKLLDEKQTSVYKRALEEKYLLKMKAARFVFSEVNQRFPTMPFTTRWLDDKRGKLGLWECVKNDLLHAYPVLYEKPDELVAQIKFTVLLMPNGSDRVTSGQLQTLETSKQLEDPDIKAILAQSVKTKKKSSGKKKKSKKAGDAATGEGEDDGDEKDS